MYVRYNFWEWDWHLNGIAKDAYALVLLWTGKDTRGMKCRKCGEEVVAAPPGSRDAYWHLNGIAEDGHRARVK